MGVTPVSPDDLRLAVFERMLSDMFRDHFGDVDWGLQFDRVGLTVTAGDRLGGPSVTVALPPDHAEGSVWLLAGELVVRLRRVAEEQGYLQPQLRA